jgi:hypothetical protein
MCALGLVSLPSSLPKNHSRETLSGTDEEITSQTIDRMRDMVTLGKREFAVRKLIKQLVFACNPKDYYCYAQKAHEFCRDQVRYVFDPSGVELIENPARILESRVADCDSIVILMASLCEQMGFPCRFVTIKADSKRPDSYSHVFLEVKIPNQGWVASDPTQPNRAFGWSPGPEYPRKNWAASKDAPEEREGDDMAGLGYLSGPIPGVQQTPGVFADQTWEFRDEPTLITMTPEALELDTMLPAGAEPVSDSRREFIYMDELESETEGPAAIMEQLQPPAPKLSGLGATFDSIPKWVLVVGGVALLWYLTKGKRK